MEIPASRRVLDNGLTVVHHEDRSAPIVAVYVYYHVGSSREVRGKTGFAHLFEHMLFQGSANVPDNGHFQLVQAAGGTLNGTTNQDRTNYFETLPVEHLELALFLESDRMGYLLPAMTQAKLDNQRDVVMNERRQSYENRPYGLVYETLLAGLYPEGHPYSWPTIGSMEDIAAATLDDVEEFFRRWYGPNNATLVIAGDVEGSRAFDLAERWFGAIGRGPDVSSPPPRPAGLTESRRLVLEDRVQLPQLTLTWPTVAAAHPDEPALNLLSDVLSANSSSLLDRALMIEEELASSVTISHANAERAGMLTVTARPAGDVTLSRIEERVDELLEGFLDTGVTEERLERLKNRLEGETLRALEEVSARAALLGHMQCFHGEVDRLGRSLALHRAVTVDDVRDVARRYLVGRPRVTLSTVPVGEGRLAAGERAPARIALPGEPDRSAPPAPGAADVLHLPPVTRFELGRAGFHGMHDEALPLVHVALTLPGGRYLEAPDESGRAALVASLLTEGTERLASVDVADTLDGLGATLAARAGGEGVTLVLSTLARTLTPSLAFLRDVLERPRFAPEDVARLVRQRLLAIRTRRDRPREVADDLFDALVFGPEDARGRATRGSAAGLEGVDADAVRALWQRLRGAGPPCLSVVGAAEVTEVVRGLGWREADLPVGELAWDDPLPPAPPAGIHLVDNPGAKQSELRVGHVALRRDDPDHDLLMAANHVLGGSFSSRINLNLREDKGWTYGARSSVGGRRRRGSFQVSTSVETGVTAQALAEVLRELERLPTGFSEEEARFASESLGRSLRRAYAGTASRLAYLDNLATYGFPLDYPNRRLEALERLRAADLDAVAARHLRHDGLAVVVVGDAEAVRGPLEALGRGPVLDGHALAGLG